MSQISISAGHYGIGTGARSIIDEVQEARKIVNRVVKLLQDQRIGLTKIEDNQSKNQKQNLDYLVIQHNKTTRKVDVSVHLNSSGKKVAHGMGTEVLYYDQVELAQKMSRKIANASGLKNRGAKKRSDLAFLANTLKPAILIEVCFVNSETDVKLFRMHFEEICLAIAQCLIDYVGGKIKGDSLNGQAMESTASAVVSRY